MTTQAQRQGLGSFAEMGFMLEPHSDDMVLLLHEGKFVAQFSQMGATGESLQAECTRHLVENHGWDDRPRSRKEANHGNHA